MNYYKQGDAANAYKIKAAFEAKAIYSNLTFANENCLYYSCDGKVDFCFIGRGLSNIIKTHPDYKELELPIEPTFKVGDWIIRNNGRSIVPIQVYGLKKDRYLVTNTLDTKGEVMLTRQDEWHLWTIEDAKDGDVLHSYSFTHDCIFIFNGLDKWKFDEPNGERAVATGYCCLTLSTDDMEFGIQGPDCIEVDTVKPANEIQRDLLFVKVKEAGYQWDAEKKELKKIKPHYDIKNFHAGMPVLVRPDNDCRWNYSVFSHITGNKDWHFAVCNGVSFTQCIPFEGNEHLLGTTDMPSEEYINW